MSSIAPDQIVVEPLDAALGASVLCDDITRLAPTERDGLRQVYLDNLMLVIKRQRLSDGALTSLADGRTQLQRASACDGA